MADTFTKLERSRIMAAVKSRDTTPERVVQAILRSLGRRFQAQGSSLPGKPDFVFARRSKVIFVHGCFWHLHGCPRCRVPSSRRAYWLAKLQRNAARDKVSVRALRRAGWRVMVVWECQTHRESIDRLRQRIARFLEQD